MQGIFHRASAVLLSGQKERTLLVQGCLKPVREGRCSSIRFDCSATSANITTQGGDPTMRILAASAFGLLASTMALAQMPPRPSSTPNLVTHVRTAADLAAVCNPSWTGVPRLEAIAYCQGFIASADQQDALLHPAGSRARPLYCLPTPPPTIAQAGVAFAAWMNANPSQADEPALEALLRWKQTTYPCPPATAPARSGRAAR
jgi:hypothetical protein